MVTLIFGYTAARPQTPEYSISDLIASDHCGGRIGGSMGQF